MGMIRRNPKKVKDSFSSQAINIELEDILNEHFDWLNDWYESNPKLPKSKTDELAKQITSLFSKYGDTAPTVKLLSTVQKNERDGSEFIFSNNLIFKVESGTTSYIVKLGTSRTSSNVAIEHLSKQGTPPWLAKTFSESKRKATKDSPFYVRPEGTYQFDVGLTEGIQIQEVCLPLTSKLSQIHNPDNANKNTNITEVAKLVGNHVSDILTEIKQKDVIWTDMKAGNILMRDDVNHPIAISDTKAFRRKDQLFTKTEKKKGTIVDNEDTTDIFISKNTGIVCKPGEALEEWDKEYSYQLATILYQIATNQEKYKNQAFDFDPEKFLYFNSEEGKRLRIVIEALGHDDPNMRMKHSDARQLLKHLNNPEEFAKLQFKIKNENNPAQIALNKLREGNISAFIEFYQSMPIADKYYNEKMTHLFMNTDLNVSDIRLLNQTRLAMENLKEDLGDRDRTRQVISNAGESLLSIIAMKQIIPPEDLSKIQSSYLTQDEKIYEDIKTLIDAHRDNNATKCDEICINELPDMYTRVQAKNGNEIVRENFDSYKNSRQFHEFVRDNLDNLKVYMNEKEYKEVKALNDAVLKPERFSFSDNPIKAARSWHALKSTSIDLIVDTILKNPDTADIFLKERSGIKSVGTQRNYRDELMNRKDLLDKLNEHPELNLKLQILGLTKAPDPVNKALISSKFNTKTVLNQAILLLDEQISKSSMIDVIDTVTVNVKKMRNKDITLNEEEKTSVKLKKIKDCIKQINTLIVRVNASSLSDKDKNKLFNDIIKRNKSLNKFKKELENTKEGKHTLKL